MYHKFSTLVNGMSCMHLTPYTVNIHKEICTNLGIITDYEKELKEGAIGGATEDDSRKHLLTRFFNSAARTQVIICIEDKSCEFISIEVLGLLNDGHIYVIDIAAGNGAGTISILNTICKMREDGDLAIESLDVEIHALDYSEDSLNYYDLLIKSLNETYKQFGIKVNLSKHKVDITDDDKVKAEIDSIKNSVRRSPKSGVGIDPRFLLLCSAISGVSKKQFIDNFSNSYKTISNSFSLKNSTFLWVEPLTKRNWMPKYWLEFWEKKQINSSEENAGDENIVKQSYRWIDPYNLNSVSTEGDYFLMDLTNK